MNLLTQHGGKAYLFKEESRAAVTYSVAHVVLIDFYIIISDINNIVVRDILKYHFYPEMQNRRACIVLKQSACQYLWTYLNQRWLMFLQDFFFFFFPCSLQPCNCDSHPHSTKCLHRMLPVEAWKIRQFLILGQFKVGVLHVLLSLNAMPTKISFSLTIFSDELGTNAYCSPH